MLPLIGAGLGLIGGIAGNAQAKANAELQAKMLYTRMKTEIESLSQQAQEMNRQVGMELTNLSFESLKSQATTSNVIAEKNIAGRATERLYNSGEIKKNLIADRIKQQAEANIVSIQNDMMNSKYAYEAGVMQTAIEQQNATKSLLELGTDTLTGYYAFGGTDPFMSKKEG